MITIKLKFISSFHSGEREGFFESTDVYIHSDTFFSAFCYSYLLLYGENKLNELLNKFLTDTPPFLISSAFPYWNNKLFFPVPLNQIPETDIKEIKKIKFIEKDGFEKLLNGNRIEEIYKKYTTIPYKNEKGEIQTPYEIVVNPRISIDRLSNSPGENYFHFAEVFYKENSGLFFIVDFKDNSIEKEFMSTIRLLGDEGIGGDRTVGKGHYKIVSEEEINFILPTDTKYQISLSLYLPKEDEIIDLQKGYYEIIERKGYIYSVHCKSLRRKSVRMFKEGSVFSKGKKGKIIDVTPEIYNTHRIYRYGLSFPLPCKIEESHED